MAGLGPVGLTRRSYNSARERCTNPSSPHYAMFGGAGIRFLLPPFEEFVRVLGTKPAQHRLSRIDPQGHYELKNVQWKFDPKIPAREPRPVWVGAHTRKTTKRIQQQLTDRARLFLLSNLDKGRALARVIGDSALAEGIAEPALRSALRSLGVKYVTETGAKWTKGMHEFCYWELAATGLPPRPSDPDPASTVLDGNRATELAEGAQLVERMARMAKRFSPIRTRPGAENKGETTGSKINRQTSKKSSNFYPLSNSTRSRRAADLFKPDLERRLLGVVPTGFPRREQHEPRN
jgi:hypothetical protein